MGVVEKIGQSGTLASFVDGIFGLAPTGGVISDIVKCWNKNKKEEARDILLSNVRQGDIECVHKEELLSMLYRFNHSVYQGVAKKNLILLARLISGIGKVDKLNTKAETFNIYAPILESLTNMEIEFLSKEISKQADIFFLEKQVLKDEMSQILQQKGVFVSENEVTMGGGMCGGGNPELKIKYVFSTLIKQMLRSYGNLWENIANTDIKKG